MCHYWPRRVYLDQPVQQCPPPQPLQTDQPPAPPRRRQDLEMEPYPLVAEHQRDPHVQQPQLRPSTRRPPPPLVHLPVARLDPESGPVRLPHPRARPPLDGPTRIGQRLAPVSLPLTAVV